MDVAIIGGGAVGLLFAAYIAKVDIKPTIYTRTTRQANLLVKEGLVLQKDEHIERYAVDAVPFEHFSGSEDIIVVAVKQYDCRAIVERLKILDDAKTILFTQNGMGHIQLLEDLKRHRIALSVVEHGVTKLVSNEVTHTGIGRIKLSDYHQSESLLGLLKEKLASPDFPILLESNWYKMIAEKLAANAVVNPLTAIYQVKNGALLHPFFKKNMEQLFVEVAATLKFEDPEQVFKQILLICEDTKDNTSSMLADLNNGRQTEVEAILGYLLHSAKKQGLPVPLTTFLYNSIKGLET
jgi:2-dehydropantoate 2-reductase